jgi:histidine triad (HIT) family protein
MTTTDKECTFCKIIQGKLSADLVYEDELAVGFWDKNPVRPIHILIVPREHIPTLNDIPEENHVLSHIRRAARAIAEHFGVAQSGYRLFFNVNREGGQEIFHLHAHLISKTNPHA